MDASEFNEKYSTVFDTIKDRVAQVQRETSPLIDLAFVLKHGYMILRKDQIQEVKGEAMSRKLAEYSEGYHTKIRDFFNRDNDFKKPYVGQVNDLIQEKRLFCPGYWTESDYGHTDTYYGVKGLVFSKENYKSQDVNDCKPGEILRPLNDVSESLDISFLPNKESEEMCHFFNDEIATPLMAALAKIFSKESIGRVNCQIGCNYYPGEPTPLGSHCDRGLMSASMGRNAEFEAYDPELQEWVKPGMNDGDILLFLGQQIHRVFEHNGKDEMLLPALPHRVMEFEEGRISVVINCFYKDLYA